MKQKLVIGTRGSKLALWQAEHIAARLRELHPGLEVTLQRIMTTGDKILDVPLAKIGGKGLFTKELENAMLNREIDLAVHSLKDMPTQLPPELVLAAIPARVHPGDALISPVHKTLAALPAGARIGTSSLRRRAQLLYCRPDLQVLDLRGNLDTRLNKLETDHLDAILLAVAGLDRLGWGERITEVLPVDICLPAVGQGSLAIEARADDQDVLELLAGLEHPATRQAVTAERAYLAEVEGGCQVPVGVYAPPPGSDGQLTLTAVILSVDGQRRVRDAISGPARQAADLGRELAQRMLAAGGRTLLQEVFGEAGERP